MLILAVAFWAAAGTAHADATLRRGIRYEPTSLDPHKYTTHDEAAVILDLFEGLTVFGADGRARPGLASEWSVSNDGHIWTFTLRPNLMWSDGAPLTSADVVFSFRRLLDPKTAAPYAPLLYVLKNARAVNTGTIGPEHLGVAANGPDTVVMTLKNPTPYLPELFANAFLAIVPEHVIAQWGEDWIKPEHIVTDGAYTLAERAPQNRIVLKRNARYHAPDAPAPTTVIYFPSSDTQAAVTRFRAGDLDVVADFPNAEMPLLRAQFASQVHVAPELATFYLALNTTVPKLADRRVRMALSLALDRDLLATKVLHGGAIAADSLVPAVIDGYDPALMDFLQPPLDKRRAEARALLTAAGYGPGRPLRVAYSHSNVTEFRRVAVAVCAMWHEIGVGCTLSATDSSTMFASLRLGNFEIAFAAWTADFDDAASFLYPLQSTSVASNYSRYHNGAFDALLARAATVADAGARAELLHQAEALVLADQPIIPVAHGLSRALVSRAVQGWSDNAIDVHLSRTLSIQPNAP